MMTCAYCFGSWIEHLNFPDGSEGKESTCNAEYIGDVGLIPGSGRSSGGGNGSPLQYSCLGNCMHRGAWWAIVPMLAKGQRQLSK